MHDILLTMFVLALSLRLLATPAQADTLQLPPGEDPAAWQAAADAAGVQLVPSPTLQLVHEGKDWFLVRSNDPTARYPIPAPDTPERRAAVVELAARVLASPAPEAAGIVPPGRDVVEPYDIAHTAPTELSQAETAELIAASRPPPPPPPVPRKPPPNWPSGWIVGVEPAGVLVAAEPRPTVAVVGGVRTKSMMLFGVVIEAGPPMEVAGTRATIERDSVRLEAGYRYFVVSAGIGRAELISRDILRGELLFPVVTAEVERPFRLPWMILSPRVAVQGTLAEMNFAWKDELWEPAMLSLSVGLRVEAAVARAP